MGENTYFKRVAEQTATRFWINNVTREEATLAINAGAVGCTQNPSYTWKMISHPVESSYVIGYLDDIIREEGDDNQVQIELQKQLVSNIAEIFMPLYEKSGGKQGYVSIQGDPFREDTDTIVKCALSNIERHPNIMAKVPVTEEGLRAIEILAAKGVPINATEVMSVRQAIDACEAYMRGTRGMTNPPVMYYSHIAGIFDQYLEGIVREQNIDIPRDILWQAGIAVAKKVYQITKERYPAIGFIGGGARGLHHFTEMVGADACITINWVGTADKLIAENPVVVQRFLQPTPHSVIDMLCSKLPDFRKAYLTYEIEAHEYEEYGPVVLFRKSFEESWKNANQYIANRRRELKYI